MKQRNPEYEIAYREYMQARDIFHDLVLKCVTNPSEETSHEKEIAYNRYLDAQDKVQNTPIYLLE